MLNELQIAELGFQNRETVIKSGLNEPYKATVLASRFKSLNEAIQISSEVIPQQHSITYTHNWSLQPISLYY